MKRPYLLLALVLLFVCASPGSRAAAQGPTVTPTPRPPTATPIPEQLHSRTSILTRIAPRSFTADPLPGNWDSSNQIGVDVVAEGGGWFRTIFNMLQTTSFGVYLGGFLILFATIGIVGVLIASVMGKVRSAADDRETVRGLERHRRSYDRYLR